MVHKMKQILVSTCWWSFRAKAVALGVSVDWVSSRTPKWYSEIRREAERRCSHREALEMGRYGSADPKSIFKGPKELRDFV